MIDDPGPLPPPFHVEMSYNAEFGNWTGTVRSTLSATDNLFREISSGDMNQIVLWLVKEYCEWLKRA